MTNLDKPIIFIGTGRSGSTYVSGAVFSHRELAYPSNYQEKMPSMLSINFLRHLFDNQFWRFTTRGSYNKKIARSFFLPSEAYSMWKYLVGEEVDFSRSFLIDSKLSEETLLRVRNYFVRMISIQGKKKLGFKITGPSRIGFLSQIFPDAYYIWVKRDLHATTSSFLLKDFWQTRGYNRLWFYDSFSEAELEFANKYLKDPAMITGIQLKKIELETEAEIIRHQTRVLRVDYNAFLKNPQKMLGEILEFTNLDMDHFVFDYIERNPVKEKMTDYRKVFGDEKYNELNELFTRNAIVN